MGNDDIMFSRSVMYADSLPTCREIWLVLMCFPSDGMNSIPCIFFKGCCCRHVNTYFSISDQHRRQAEHIIWN